MIVAKADNSTPLDAAYRVLAELGFPLPINTSDLLTYLGLECAHDPDLPEKVRGVLDVRAHLVIVKSGLLPSAERQVIVHEGGHSVLHKPVLFRCSEFDLSESVRKRLEAEANAFSATLRFGALPRSWLEDADLSLDGVSRLANTTEASFEAALRWFVENNRRLVWAVMCRPLDRALERRSNEPLWLSVRYACASTCAPNPSWPAAVRLMPQHVPSSSPLALAGDDPWPQGVKRYQRLGASKCEIYATSYWTCFLLS